MQVCEALLSSVFMVAVSRSLCSISVILIPVFHVGDCPQMFVRTADSQKPAQQSALLPQGKATSQALLVLFPARFITSIAAFPLSLLLCDVRLGVGAAAAAVKLVELLWF